MYLPTRYSEHTTCPFKCDHLKELRPLMEQADQKRLRSSNGIARDATDIVFEAGKRVMQMVKGAYSCLTLVMDVGIVAFRDPYGIRCPSSKLLLL